ncbi:thiopeptide-type bacteriocin biosynthesis protein [Nonomuraea sp. NPDC049655]|uniref:thiopeptide-type bacteriocin biosynthesis protein n=1 Tax=Nonomuraea sp. NPDC049655 TaxID=3364355 RepID=UPI00378F805F
MRWDWLYYRLLVQSGDHLQDVVEHPLSRLIGAADGIERWFFLRFTDRWGPHVRLRLAATPDRISGLRRLARQVFEVRDAWPKRLTESWRGAALSLYEPELAKYGGVAGVANAERVFHASSELALSLAPSLAGPGRRERRLAAALAVTRTAAELLPPTGRRSFLYHMAWHWTGHDQERRARIRLLAGRRPVEPAPMSGPAFDLYGHHLERALAEGPRPAPHLLFHFVHTTNNRLGLNVLEEALIAEQLLLG